MLPVLPALLLTLGGAQTVTVAYIGNPSAFVPGWRIAAQKIASIGGFPVNKGAQTFGITSLEFFIDDTSSNPHRLENVTTAVSDAAAAGADVIVVGSSQLNKQVMLDAERLGVPNIHCSGGNPTFWESTQPHSFGMHVPFPWYSKGAISAGKVRGLRTLSVMRTVEWGFPKASGLSALEWAREAGYTVIGPTAQWCSAYAQLTATCRLVNASGGTRCVCAQQSEVDALGYSNLNLESFPSLYEMYDARIAEPDFGGLKSAKVSMSMVRFAEGIIDDIRSQGADPDVLVSWVEMHRSVLYAAMRKDFNPKMWVGVPNKAGRSWPGVEATMHGSPSTQALETRHALYTVTGMQWNPALREQDPVFNTNAQYVAEFEQMYGRKPGYDEAACTSAGSVIYLALKKYSTRLDVNDSQQRRQELRLGIGDLNDKTLYGMTRFNKGGQNNGRGAVAVQLLPEGADGVQRVVLPADVSESPLTLPMPTWDSKFGCSPGHFNTGDRCSPCGPGRFNPFTTAGLNVTECQQCARGSGTNSTATGAVQCGGCAAGRVQDGGLHQGICRGCSPGTFRDASMPGTDCELCDSGRFSGALGAHACDACQEGTYQSDKGQTKCICSLGWYRNPAASFARPCLSCLGVLPGSTTRNSGSISASECTCARGFYLRAAACHSCTDDFPDGSVECAGFGAQPILRKGWMTRQGEATVYRCAGTGEACPGGVPVGTERCSEGGSDIACAWCGEGYRYHASAGKCAACGSAGVVFWFVMVLPALFLAVVLRPPTAEYSKANVTKALRNSFVALTLAQISDVFQLYAILSSTSLEFSSDEKSMFSGAGGLFSMDTLSPLCYISGGRGEHALKVVLLFNLLPAFFIGWLIVCALPALFSKRLRSIRFPSYISSCNMALGTLVSFFTTVLNLAINLVGARYEHPDIGQTSLLAFPYITDQASEVTGLLVVAGFSLAVWCVGTLAFVTFMCFYLQTTRPSVRTRRCTVALIVRHRDGYNWWLIVELVMKFLVALSVALFKRPDLQLQWMVTIFILYAMLLVHVKPYRFLRHNFSDGILTFAKIMMLVLAVTTVHNKGPSQSGIMVLMGLTFAFCGVFAVWCLYTVLTGNAVNTEVDEQTLAKAKAYLGMTGNFLAIGEVVPDAADMPKHLRSRAATKASIASKASKTSRTSKAPRTSAFVSRVSSAMGLEMDEDEDEDAPEAQAPGAQAPEAKEAGAEPPPQRELRFTVV